MTSDHVAMLRRWIWRDFANVALGAWLMASPASMGFAGTALGVSDLASGATLVALGILTLFPRFDLARWGCRRDHRVTLERRGGRRCARRTQYSARPHRGAVRLVEPFPRLIMFFI